MSTPGLARWRPADRHQDAAEGTQDARPDPAKTAREADRERREADRKRRVASLLAANRAGRRADPEGMGAARSWRPFP